jgi:hypothetical protein
MNVVGLGGLHDEAESLFLACHGRSAKRLHGFPEVAG